MVSEKVNIAKNSLAGKVWQCLAVFVILFGLVLALQHRNNAYESDFGHHPDEAAHVVTGLMVRDYLDGPLWKGEHPMRFAEDYYERFPKVALGHYPPGFYVMEGVWLLPSRSKVAVRLFSVALTVTVAMLTFCLACGYMPRLLAFCSAAMFVYFPLVQFYTAIVMSDMLVTIFCLLAAIAFANFLIKEKWVWSLAFGLMAAAAILTKASGLMLVFIPPVAIILTRRWKLLLKPALWLAPIPVLLFALPWMLATAHISEEGMLGVRWIDYIQNAVPFYAGGLVTVFGIVMSVVLLFAAVMCIRAWLRDREIPPMDACLWALIVAVPIFYLIISVGYENRYLLPMLPPGLILGFAAIWEGLRKWNQSQRNLPVIVGCSALVTVTFVEMYRSPLAPSFGSSLVVAEVCAKRDGPQTLLICSDASGEGSMVAAAALEAPTQLKVLRGTKILSTSDWMGRDYTLAFNGAGELEKLLSAEKVDFIILDESVPADRRWEHQNEVRSLISGRELKFQEEWSVPMYRKGKTSELEVYLLSNGLAK